MIDKEMAGVVVVTKLSIVCFEAIAAPLEIMVPVCWLMRYLMNLVLAKYPSPGTRCVAVETSIRTGAAGFSLKCAAAPSGAPFLWSALFLFSMIVTEARAIAANLLY